MPSDDTPHVNDVLTKLLPGLSIVDESLVRVRDRTTLQLETFNISDEAADDIMENGDQIALMLEAASLEEEHLANEDEGQWEREVKQ